VWEIRKGTLIGKKKKDSSREGSGECGESSSCGRAQGKGVLSVRVGIGEAWRPIRLEGKGLVQERKESLREKKK